MAAAVLSPYERDRATVRTAGARRGRVSVDPRTHDLIRRLARQLDKRFTPAGHLAQLVSQEHLGICSWRGCAPPCHEARLLLIEAAEYIEAHDVRQLELMREAM